VQGGWDHRTGPEREQCSPGPRLRCIASPLCSETPRHQTPHHFGLVFFFFLFPATWHPCLSALPAPRARLSSPVSAPSPPSPPSSTVGPLVLTALCLHRV
jgi:hypothetical protein